MKAVVVYESHWGNTAAIARAIAEGIGQGTLALSTAEASGEAIAGADLIVAGAPVMGFRLPDEKMRENLRLDTGKTHAPPDLSHPSMRAWLAGLPKGKGRSAAFDTRVWWTLGGSTGAITRGLQAAGYPPIAPQHKFIVTGAYGPLRPGEEERARQWGEELGRALGQG